MNLSVVLMLISFGVNCWTSKITWSLSSSTFNVEPDFSRRKSFVRHGRTYPLRDTDGDDGFQIDDNRSSRRKAVPNSWSNKRERRNGRSQSSHQSRNDNGTMFDIFWKNKWRHKNHRLESQLLSFLFSFQKSKSEISTEQNVLHRKLTVIALNVLFSWRKLRKYWSNREAALDLYSLWFRVDFFAASKNRWCLTHAVAITIKISNFHSFRTFARWVEQSSWRTDKHHAHAQRSTKLRGWFLCFWRCARNKIRHRTSLSRY